MDIQPGDCLLYRPTSLFGWLIAVKTWTKVSHCEIALGDDMAAASRDGLGVNLYPLRTADLAYVLRPNHPFDFARAADWFQSVRGQKYDWKGLLCFTLAAKQGAKDRMFCSEFATRFYRAGGFVPFGDVMDADKVPPSLFLFSSSFTVIWQAE